MGIMSSIIFSQIAEMKNAIYTPSIAYVTSPRLSFRGVACTTPLAGDRALARVFCFLCFLFCFCHMPPMSVT